MMANDNNIIRSDKNVELDWEISFAGPMGKNPRRIGAALEEKK